MQVRALYAAPAMQRSQHTHTYTRGRHRDYAAQVGFGVLIVPVSGAHAFLS